MPRALPILLLLLPLCALAQQTHIGKVVRIADGDTLSIMRGESPSLRPKGGGDPERRASLRKRGAPTPSRQPPNGQYHSEHGAVVIAEDMPNYNVADVFSIAYGNFSRGYLIVDRVGMRVIRDDVTELGLVILRFFRRYSGGNVMNSESIKLLKSSAM